MGVNAALRMNAAESNAGCWGGTELISSFHTKGIVVNEGKPPKTGIVPRPIKKGIG